MRWVRQGEKMYTMSVFFQENGAYRAIIIKSTVQKQIGT
jgi:hypothetical protein